jgi:hypothetical protein
MIEISNDKLFKLVQEMKELRTMLPRVTTADYTKIYRLKIQEELLDNMLTHEGLNDFFNEILRRKVRLQTDLNIKSEIESEDVRITQEVW